MFFNAPDNLKDVNIGGEQFTVDANGQIETPDTGDYVQLLAPHGFYMAAKATPKEAVEEQPIQTDNAQPTLDKGSE